jgi:hypothetical protein
MESAIFELNAFEDADKRRHGPIQADTVFEPP